MLQRHYIDLRLMSKTNKRTSHAIHARCTDESIYLCNKVKCRQITPTTDPNQLNGISTTENSAKLNVFCKTCGTMWIVCHLCNKRFNFTNKIRAEKHFQTVHKIPSEPNYMYKQNSLNINEIELSFNCNSDMSSIST